MTEVRRRGVSVGGRRRGEGVGCRGAWWLWVGTWWVRSWGWVGRVECSGERGGVVRGAWASGAAEGGLAHWGSGVEGLMPETCPPHACTARM